MVAMLTINDFLSSVALAAAGINWLKQGESQGHLCIYEAFSIQLFFLSDAFWALCIAIYLYLRVVFGKSWKWKLEGTFHAVCFVIPLILSIPPFFGPTRYGHAGVWCWLTAEPVYTRWVLFYAFIFAIMIVISLLYGLVIFYIKGRMNEQHNERRKIVVRVAAYPAVFVIVWIPGVINRMQISIDPTNQYLVLFFFHLFFVPLQGFLNAFAYGWNENLLKKYKKLIVRHLAKKYASRFAKNMSSFDSSSDGPTANSEPNSPKITNA